jgi:hypothetical protein
MNVIFPPGELSTRTLTAAVVSLGPFSNKQARTDAELAETLAVIETYTQPGPIDQIVVMVVTLLSFKRDVTRSLPTDDGVAALWREILAPYPAWAVREACIWWLGADNPNCGFPPVPGQIEARVREVLAPLHRAANICRLGVVPPALPPEERVWVTPEQAAQIMREAGYGGLVVLKRFGRDEDDDAPKQVSGRPNAATDAADRGAAALSDKTPADSHKWRTPDTASLEESRAKNALVMAARADQAMERDD